MDCELYDTLAWITDAHHMNLKEEVQRKQTYKSHSQVCVWWLKKWCERREEGQCGFITALNTLISWQKLGIWCTDKGTNQKFIIDSWRVLNFYSLNMQFACPPLDFRAGHVCHASEERCRVFASTGAIECGVPVLELAQIFYSLVGCLSFRYK